MKSATDCFLRVVRKDTFVTSQITHKSVQTLLSSSSSSGSNGFRSRLLGDANGLLLGDPMDLRWFVLDGEGDLDDVSSIFLIGLRYSVLCGDSRSCCTKFSNSSSSSESSTQVLRSISVISEGPGAGASKTGYSTRVIFGQLAGVVGESSSRVFWGLEDGVFEKAFLSAFMACRFRGI